MNIKKVLVTYFHSLSSVNRRLFFATIIIYTLSFSLAVLEYLTDLDYIHSTPSLIYTIKFFQPKLSIGEDSWSVMKIALDYFQSSKSIPIYDKLFFEDNIKFQYPLTSLLFYIPFRFICLGNTLLFIKLVSWLSILLLIFFVIKIFNLNMENKQNITNKITQILLITVLSLNFYPVMKAYGLGQIQTWINAMFGMSIFYYIHYRMKTVGFLVALMCLIKPQYCIIFIWAILRKQWSFVKSFTLTCLIGVFISFIFFGFQNNFNYLKVLSFISKHGESFHANQSMNGLLNRLLFNGRNLIWDPNTFAPFNKVVYLGTILTSTLLIIYALFRRMKVSAKGSLIDYFIISISATIASPIAWEHHYGILLGTYAFLFAPLLGKEKVTKPLLLLGVSYILSSQYFSVIDRLTHDTLFNFLQSYLFYSALMLLGYLYWLELSQLDLGVTRKQQV